MLHFPTSLTFIPNAYSSPGPNTNQTLTLLPLRPSVSCFQSTHWICRIVITCPFPPVFVLLIFQTGGWPCCISFFALCLVRLGPLFSPVQLCWLPVCLPSCSAVDSSRDVAFLALLAQRPYQNEVRPEKRVLQLLELTGAAPPFLAGCEW